MLSKIIKKGIALKVCINNSICNIIFLTINSYKTASEGAFCGNKIVENGEECDCGYDNDECDDKCCYPRQVADRDRFHNISAKGCARRAQTECRYVAIETINLLL